MKPILYKTLIIFFFIGANHNSIKAQSSNLDGNSYKIELSMQKGSSSWSKDTFVFKSGEMYSHYLRKREGFKSAPYSPILQGEVIKFSYDSKNMYGSTLKIDGTAQGNTIEGTLVWKDDGGIHNYTFTGTLIEPK